MSHDENADVLIVGSGIMGSLTARSIAERRPDLDLLVVEAGPNLTPERPGANLKDIHDLRLRAELQIRSQGPDRFSYGIDALHDRTRTVVSEGTLADLVRAGTFLASRAGHEASEMPALAMSANVGGMGAHWTCACPAPGEAEISPDVPYDEWQQAWDEASRYLAVTRQCFPPSPLADWVLDRIRGFAGPRSRRVPQEMPMSRHASGLWGSPAVILDRLRHRLRSEVQCMEVLLDDGVVQGARVRDLRDGTDSIVRAPVVVVAGDSLRTPQLLHASGIRPWALGRFLNEHARILSSVPLADSDAAGIAASHNVIDPTDPMVGSFWMPYDPPTQQFHVQLSLIDSGMLAGGASSTADGMSISLSTLVPTDVTSHNRLDFSDDETDAFGMPAFRVRFSRSVADKARIEAAVNAQVDLQQHINPNAQVAAPTLMPPGSSLHYSGTVRSGRSDDGQSVCDTHGRVWGIEGLYVAGNGVAPTSLAHNATPSGAGFAVRSGAAIARSAP